MPKKAERKWKATELVDMLRIKYSGMECAVFEQVANGTGAYTDSWIDVATIDLWPSRGYVRRAFEVKVSRSDFLNEIANPKKKGIIYLTPHSLYDILLIDKEINHVSGYD